MKIIYSARGAKPDKALNFLRKELANCKSVELYSLMDISDNPLYDIASKRKTFFRTSKQRSIDIDYIPISYSNIPEFMKKTKFDIGIVGLSTDGNNLSFGVSHDFSRAIIDSSNSIIYEIKSKMPFTNICDVDIKKSIKIFYNDNEIDSIPGMSCENESFVKISSSIVDFIKDNDWIQLGVGKIPESVVYELIRRKIRVNVYSEAISNWVMLLHKNRLLGDCYCSFAWGDANFYEWLNNNDVVRFGAIDKINNIENAPDGIVTINSGIHVDESRNVNAHYLNNKVYSGIGGHRDFCKIGSKKGISIIAMQEEKHKKIVDKVEKITTLGKYVDHVITEKNIL